MKDNWTAEKEKTEEFIAMAEKFAPCITDPDNWFVVFPDMPERRKACVRQDWEESSWDEEQEEQEEEDETPWTLEEDEEQEEQEEEDKTPWILEEDEEQEEHQCWRPVRIKLMKRKAQEEAWKRKFKLKKINMTNCDPK